jgi:16S rRNA G966 N2-methylase RsmD
MTDRCRVCCIDYADFLRSAGQEGFDLVFLDPPYAARLICPALRGLLSAGLLRTGALVVCESEEEDVFEGNEALHEHFNVRRKARYAKAVVTILERKQ